MVNVPDRYIDRRTHDRVMSLQRTKMWFAQRTSRLEKPDYVKNGAPSESAYHLSAQGMAWMLSWPENVEATIVYNVGCKENTKL